VRIGDTTTALQVMDGDGVHVRPQPPSTDAHVRLRLTLETFRALLAGEATAATADVGVEGDPAAAAALRGWVDRVLGT
jgi:hypothetical protein